MTSPASVAATTHSPDFIEPYMTLGQGQIGTHIGDGHFLGNVTTGNTGAQFNFGDKNRLALELRTGLAAQHRYYESGYGRLEMTGFGPDVSILVEGPWIGPLNQQFGLRGHALYSGFTYMKTGEQKATFAGYDFFFGGGLMGGVTKEIKGMNLGLSGEFLWYPDFDGDIHKVATVNFGVTL